MTTPNIRTALGKRLKQAGFTKVRASAWRRPAGAYLDEVDLQRSQFSDGVAVNLRCVDVEVRDKVYRLLGRPGFRDAFSVQERLAALVDGRDSWWDGNDPNAGAQIIDHLESHGLPFLERLHSDEGLVVQIKAGGAGGVFSFHLACHLARLGRFGEADDVLAKVEASKRADWPQMAATLRRALAVDEGRGAGVAAGPDGVKRL